MHDVAKFELIGAASPDRSETLLQEINRTIKELAGEFFDEEVEGVKAGLTIKVDLRHEKASNSILVAGEISGVRRPKKKRRAMACYMNADGLMTQAHRQVAIDFAQDLKAKGVTVEVRKATTPAEQVAALERAEEMRRRPGESQAAAALLARVQAALPGVPVFLGTMSASAYAVE